MTQSRFSKNGNMYFPRSAESLVVFDRLPAQTYTVMFNPDMGGYYLQISDPFDVPQKLYGSVHRDAARILNTFHSRPAATGVMLSGDAGSGKTMLAKKLSVDGILSDIPTLIVNSEFAGVGFNSFIQSIDQDAIVIFDEFEKIYDEESQEKVLTLLDGTVKTKKLFIFTCNDKWRVNSHMKNRPGRIFYLMEYKGLTEAFIREFCSDCLKKDLQHHVDAIVQFADTFRSFNFDILKALVEEMNRYNEGPKEAVQMLNARPGYDTNEVKYEMTVVTPNGSRYPLPNTWKGAPLVDNFDISLRMWWKPEDDVPMDQIRYFATREEVMAAHKCQMHEVAAENFYWDSDGMIGMQPDKSILVENDEGWKLILKKAKIREEPGVSILF